MGNNNSRPVDQQDNDSSPNKVSSTTKPPLLQSDPTIYPSVQYWVPIFGHPVDIGAVRLMGDFAVTDTHLFGCHILTPANQPLASYVSNDELWERFGAEDLDSFSTELDDCDSFGVGNQELKIDIGNGNNPPSASPSSQSTSPTNAPSHKTIGYHDYGSSQTVDHIVVLAGKRALQRALRFEHSTSDEQWAQDPTASRRNELYSILNSPIRFKQPYWRFSRPTCSKFEKLIARYGLSSRKPCAGGYSDQSYNGDDATGSSTVVTKSFCVRNVPTGATSAKRDEDDGGDNDDPSWYPGLLPNHTPFAFPAGPLLLNGNLDVVDPTGRSLCQFGIQSHVITVKRFFLNTRTHPKLAPIGASPKIFSAKRQASTPKDLSQGGSGEKNGMGSEKQKVLADQQSTSVDHVDLLNPKPTPDDTPSANDNTPAPALPPSQTIPIYKISIAQSRQYRRVPVLYQIDLAPLRPPPVSGYYPPTYNPHQLEYDTWAGKSREEEYPLWALEALSEQKEAWKMAMLESWGKDGVGVKGKKKQTTSNTTKKGTPGRKALYSDTVLNVWMSKLVKNRLWNPLYGIFKILFEEDAKEKERLQNRRSIESANYTLRTNYRGPTGPSTFDNYNDPDNQKKIKEIVRKKLVMPTPTSAQSAHNPTCIAVRPSAHLYGFPFVSGPRLQETPSLITKALNGEQDEYKWFEPETTVPSLLEDSAHRLQTFLDANNINQHLATILVVDSKNGGLKHLEDFLALLPGAGGHCDEKSNGVETSELSKQSTNEPKPEPDAAKQDTSPPQTTTTTATTTATRVTPAFLDAPLHVIFVHPPANEALDTQYITPGEVQSRLINAGFTSLFLTQVQCSPTRHSESWLNPDVSLLPHLLHNGALVKTEPLMQKEEWDAFVGPIWQRVFDLQYGPDHCR